MTVYQNQCVFCGGESADCSCKAEMKEALVRRSELEHARQELSFYQEQERIDLRRLRQAEEDLYVTENYVMFYAEKVKELEAKDELDLAR